MRIITRKRLNEAAAHHAKLAPTLSNWHDVARKAVWRKLTDTCQTFPHADQVKVKSGRIVTVFNLTSAYRLITAIHYNRQCIYILKILTHAEYDRDKWKTNL